MIGLGGFPSIFGPTVIPSIVCIVLAKDSANETKALPQQPLLHGVCTVGIGICFLYQLS